MSSAEEEKMYMWRSDAGKEFVENLKKVFILFTSPLGFFPLVFRNPHLLEYILNMKLFHPSLTLFLLLDILNDAIDSISYNQTFHRQI